MHEQTVYWELAVFYFDASLDILTERTFTDYTSMWVQAKKDRITIRIILGVENNLWAYEEYGSSKQRPQSKTATLRSKTVFDLEYWHPTQFIPSSENVNVEAAQGDNRVTSSRETEACIHLLCAQCLVSP
jgi:hypothetical protein